MPISATQFHDGAYWSSIERLLHRAIAMANLMPVNVWSGSANDRISERIIGNIFKHRIVIADISDLNPNVMLELGLRLSSKMPTVIVYGSATVIPFDISDFHCIRYPEDLNIFAMEKFLEELSENLRAKLAEFAQDKYTPFLGNITVDVVEPQTRELSVSGAILEKLDSLNLRFAEIESSSFQEKRLEEEKSAPSSATRRPQPYRYLKLEGPAAFNVMEIEHVIFSHPDIISYTKSSSGNGTVLIDVKLNGNPPFVKFDDELIGRLRDHHFEIV
jgi:hypothetical protein